LLTPELNSAEAIADPEADQDRAGPHRWTKDEAREAARLSRESRTKRGKREPPSDAEIERGLRERAVSDPRAAEILLRWLQRPRPLTPEDDALKALSVEQLERLHQGLTRICLMPAEAQAKVIERLLAGVDVVPTGTTS
jgi:hypothetical protein